MALLGSLIYCTILVFMRPANITILALVLPVATQFYQCVLNGILTSISMARLSSVTNRGSDPGATLPIQTWC